MKRTFGFGLCALCVVVAACSDTEEPPPPVITDAATDVPRVDATPDGGPVDATDVATDRAPEGGATDVRPDAGSDVGPEGGQGDGGPRGCDNTQLVQGCQVGRCTLNSTAGPLPPGASLVLAEKPLPADLGADAISPVLCSVTLPNGVQQVSDLTLAIRLDAAADPQAILFAAGAAPRQISASGPVATQVAGIITTSGDYGATQRPPPWKLDGYVGVDQMSSAGQAALLRNLSSRGFSAAFFDGTRLFVGNGNRVLVYRGLPQGPSVAPEIVLGQPDLESDLTGNSSSVLANGIGAIWSDGTRLVVANINRVLIWQQMPAQSFVPADIVLGQPDFSSNLANNGGISAASLSNVQSLDSDGTKLYVGDLANHRVLVWNTFPEAIRQPADLVIGQPSFSSGAVAGGATGFYQIGGVVTTPGGVFVSGYFSPGVAHFAPVTISNPLSDFLALSQSASIAPGSIYTGGGLARTSAGLAMRDSGLNRIVVSSALPTAPVTSNYFVLGQPDRQRSMPLAVSASTVGNTLPLGGGSALLVPDTNRLLVWATPPTYDFEPASRVIGQAGFATNRIGVDYRAITAASLAGPADVAVSGGRVAVADRGNNRVLIYDETSVGTSGTAATTVLGQPDDKSYVPNLDQSTPNAARLSGPSGVALAGGRLIVADTENHRVLVWNSVPTATGTAADLVLGQANFSANRPNHGRGDADNDGISDVAADGFFYPVGVASDGTHLFIADQLNHRVLVWNTFPTTNGQPADAVLGQSNLTSGVANRGNGPFVAVADGFNLPTGLFLAGTSLWVADTENNRAVRWDSVTTSPTAAAFAGQADGTTVSNPNVTPPSGVNVGFPIAQPTAATSVLRPRSVAVAGTQLFISETLSNRVHVLDAGTLQNTGVIGQTSNTSSASNAGGVGAASLDGPAGLTISGANLYVADTGNHRVLRYTVATLPATGSANAVVGQTTFAANGFNASGAVSGGVVAGPRGLARYGTSLYVADAVNHRVLVFNAPPMPSDAATRVYGQPDDKVALPNAGGAPSARTLLSPGGVYADAQHFVVADSGNNRVLVWDTTSSSPDANLVLGQSDFTTTVPNAGGPSAARMSSPAGVYYDGTRLYVADSGNHRVLVWNAFPTQSGQPADHVLGQATFDQIKTNRGSATPGAGTLAVPTGVVVVNGVTYVADSGNNRVVLFDAPASNGPDAKGVLGQPDLTSRTPASLASDRSKLAGPVAVAFDGTNVCVLDRDLARVVRYTVDATTGASSAILIGAAGELTLASPGGFAIDRTPLFTARMYLSDTGNNRIAVVSSISRISE